MKRYALIVQAVRLFGVLHTFGRAPSLPASRPLARPKLVIRHPAWLFGLLSLCGIGTVEAYPLDGYAETGLVRLEGYRLAQEGRVRGRRLPSGALFPTDSIRLRLADQPGFRIPEPDPALSAALRRIVASTNGHYGISLLDLSDPQNIRHAAVNAHTSLSPGSVGKLVVALGLFQALADLYPDNVAKRREILQTTPVVADAYIHNDHHTVPFWRPGDGRIVKRRLRQGDRGTLLTFVDWMLSNSSNAAASMVIKNLVLLRHYGTAYPRPLEEMDHFLKTTPKRTLSDLLISSLQDPVVHNGLNLEEFRQGGFFTGTGKYRIPGTNSRMTSRELMRFLTLMEQGKLVDPFSSLEIKRLLYVTDRRIRYASAPSLRHSAVYFKSGSYYKCKKEPGFACQKYKGNVVNIMNSAAIVHTPDRSPPLYYMVSIVSNVLYQNQAYAHQQLATKIHALIKRQHPRLPGQSTEIRQSTR